MTMPKNQNTRRKGLLLMSSCAVLFISACAEVSTTPEGEPCVEPAQGFVISDVYTGKFGPAPLPECPPVVVPPVLPPEGDPNLPDDEEDPEDPPKKVKYDGPLVRPGYQPGTSPDIPSTDGFHEVNQRAVDAVSANQNRGGQLGRPGL